MIPNRVITGLRRGPSKEQDAGFTSNKIRVFRVLIEPIFTLFIPIKDLGAKGEGSIRVEGGLVVGIGRISVGSDLGEDAIGLFDEVLVNGVSVGGSEVNADGAAKYKDGDETAQNCDLNVVEGFLDLTTTWKRVSSGASVRGW